MSSRHRWLLCLVVTLLFAAAAVRTQSAAGPVPIDKLLETSRMRHNIPALAMVATRGDGILEAGAVGVRRNGESSRVTPDDLFHLGSNAKAMTATLLAELIEDGQLGWDTTPATVFSDAKERILPDYRNVTLTDLLAHHAGVPAYDETESSDFRQLRPLSGSPLEQRMDFALWVLGRKPAVAPRTKRLYSNAGYAIAAAMAERVTGQSWEALIRTRVFEPLGIHPTFEWPAFDDAEQPWGHYETKNGVRPHDPHDNYQLPVFLAPAGSLSISPKEYARFLQLHLRGLEGQGGLLKADTIKRLHTPVDEKTALGWGVQQFEGALASVHSGSAGTFYAVVAMWPSRDLAVAVFANAGDERAESACVEILKTLARRYDSR